MPQINIIRFQLRVLNVRRLVTTLKRIVTWSEISRGVHNALREQITCTTFLQEETKKNMFIGLIMKQITREFLPI